MPPQKNIRKTALTDRKGIVAATIFWAIVAALVAIVTFVYQLVKDDLDRKTKPYLPPSQTTSPSNKSTPPSSLKPSNNNLIPSKPSPPIDSKPPDPEPPKISNHNFLEGKWIVEERATSELENWKVITWDYDLKISNNTLKLEGRKIGVDGKEPTRGERLAVSILELEYDGFYQANGRFEETNYRGEVLQGAVKLDFATDLKSFNGVARGRSENTSSITGRKQ